MNIDKILTAIRNEPHLLGRLLGHDILNRTHSEWIKYVFESKKDITLMAHRNSLKTTSVIIIGVVWALLYHPSTRILIASNTKENAKKSKANQA